MTQNISTQGNLEDDFLITDGMTKRFFTQNCKKFAKKFEVILCDDEGETYKDNAKGVTNLKMIRWKENRDE